MKVYITGVSGTGKTSISEALNTKGIESIDSDCISDWRNKYTNKKVERRPDGDDEWHASNKWICDIGKLKEILSRAKHVVVAGSAYNQDDFIEFFDKVFVLECGPKIITTRIKYRTNNNYGKHPSELRRILEWQKVFVAEMLKKGAIKINVERPLNEVVDDILSNFDGSL